MLLLVHHAEAESPGVDPMQPLSARGRAQAELVARDAAGRGLAPDLIWHSGKLRGRQTADALWRVCNPFAGLTAVRGLLPGDPPEWICDALAGETRVIAVVGHMPHLPALLNLLTTGSREAAPGFPLHGAVALEHADANGLRWAEQWRITLPSDE